MSQCFARHSALLPAWTAAVAAVPARPAPLHALALAWANSRVVTAPQLAFLASLSVFSRVFLLFLVLQNALSSLHLCTVALQH